MKVIDSFFIALGFKTDPAGLDGFRKKTEAARQSMLSLGNSVRTAVVSLGAGFGLAKIAKIGSTFEQNRIAIAGFLSALNLSSDFNAGLTDAADIIKQITLDAAKLPGEAEEYIEVFKAALPFVQKAIPGGSLKDMTNFTNQITAIGKTLGVDAEQIGRDTALMLSPKGRAGGHVRTFQQMLPFMRNIKGQADLTAESFNQMTAPQRFDLLQKAFETLQPMLSESATSFDAMWGAAKSAVIQITRLSTTPLFEGMKRSLNAFNALFFDANGKVTEFGQNFIDNAKEIGIWIGRVVTAGVDIVTWLGKFKVAVLLAKAAFLALLAVTLGPMVLLGLAIALVTEDIHGFYNNADSLTGLLVNRFKPALIAIGTAAAVVGVRMAVAATKMAAAWVAAAARVAIAWALVNLPLFLTVVAIAAIVTAAYLLWENWDQVVAGMTKTWDDFVAAIKRAPHDFAVALGFGTTEEEAARNTSERAAAGRVAGGITAPGADVVWNNPATGLQETHRAGWTPPTASMGGASIDRSSSARTTVNQTTVSVPEINITTSDPAESGRAVRSELERMGREGTRNAQTGVAY